MNRKSLTLSTVLALGAIGTIAWAATPAQKIAERQATYKIVGRSAKAIRDELGKPSPDLAVIRTNATSLHQSARRTGQLFVRGTGPETGVKTAALPGIWTNFPDFRSRHIKFVAAARGVEIAARTNNVETVKAAMGKLGSTCKDCHDTYRAKD